MRQSYQFAHVVYTYMPLVVIKYFNKVALGTNFILQSFKTVVPYLTTYNISSNTPLTYFSIVSSSFLTKCQLSCCATYRRRNRLLSKDFSKWPNPDVNQPLKLFPGLDKRETVGRYFRWLLDVDWLSDNQRFWLWQFVIPSHWMSAPIWKVCHSSGLL